MLLTTIGTTVLDIFGWGIYTCYITSNGLDVFRTSDGVKVAYCYRAGSTCGTGNDDGIFIGTTTGVYFLPKDLVSGNCSTSTSLVYNVTQLTASSIKDLDSMGQRLLIVTTAGIDYIPNLQTDSIIYSCTVTGVTKCVMNETRMAFLKPTSTVYVSELPGGDWVVADMKTPGYWSGSPGSVTLQSAQASLYPTGEDRYNVIHLRDDYFVVSALDSASDNHNYSSARAIILYKIISGQAIEIQRFNWEAPGAVYYQFYLTKIDENSFFLASTSDSFPTSIVRLIEGRLVLAPARGYMGIANSLLKEITGTGGKYVSVRNTTGAAAQTFIITDLFSDIPTYVQDTWIFDMSEHNFDIIGAQWMLGRNYSHLYPGHWTGSAYVNDAILADWGSTTSAFVRGSIAYIQLSGNAFFTLYDMSTDINLTTPIGTVAIPSEITSFLNDDGRIFVINNYEYFVGYNATTYTIYVYSLAGDGLSFNLEYTFAPRSNPGYGPIDLAIGDNFAMAFWDNTEDMHVYELAPTSWVPSSLGTVVDIDLGEHLFLAVTSQGIKWIDISDLTVDITPTTISVPNSSTIKSVSVSSDATDQVGLIAYSTSLDSGIFKPTEP